MLIFLFLWRHLSFSLLGSWIRINFLVFGGAVAEIAFLVVIGARSFGHEV